MAPSLQLTRCGLHVEGSSLIDHTPLSEPLIDTDIGLDTRTIPSSELTALVKEQFFMNAHELGNYDPHATASASRPPRQRRLPPQRSPDSRRRLAKSRALLSRSSTFLGTTSSRFIRPTEGSFYRWISVSREHLMPQGRICQLDADDSKLYLRLFIRTVVWTADPCHSHTILTAFASSSPTSRSPCYRTMSATRGVPIYLVRLQLTNDLVTLARAGGAARAWQLPKLLEGANTARGGASVDV
ncbi:hypothetical protein MSAN_01759200 [Mycena sanguinolenta]|uniref:Uncharacterized protein n=1 Tax=Mycena sanguinolenta TaxID=230812 RepID=A0A8H6XV05_9AGAR|nr:hypothetical protein MSAN_01759200 [Mycena sanguinolenta]